MTTVKNEIRCSIVIPVLESYEVVNRQLLHFNRILPDDWELLLMDDGSAPAIISRLHPQAKEILEKSNFQLIETHDTRSWSEPAASNTGAKLAQGKYYFHTDIDHIVTAESIAAINNNDFQKMTFTRTWGILDEDGNICTDIDILKQYGLKDELIGKIGTHANTFAMDRQIFLDLGGFDEKFCGDYGRHDADFNDRYGVQSHKNNWVNLKGGLMYVYPDPNRDVMGLFHGLRNHKKKTGSYQNYKR